MGLAIRLINAYQRYLSPHKGFCCAHRVAMGGPSCSEFAKLGIADKGFWPALADIRQRLRDCKKAALMLNQAAKDRETGKKKDSLKDTCVDCGLNGACELGSLPSRKCGASECGACDCSPF